MREYETTLIVQPEISEEGSAAILSKLDGILESHGDIRLFCDDLGKRKLAYEIRKFHKGHYYVLTYLGDGKAVPDLEHSLRLEESVLRFLTIQANDAVVDVEARTAEGAEYEKEQAKRAAEKAAREVEEARAREEAEQAAAEERAAAAAAAAEEKPAAAAAEEEPTSTAVEEPTAAAEEQEPSDADATDAAPKPAADEKPDEAGAAEDDSGSSADEEEKS
ncbi:MAG: 30S ribosomal protein S6 [Proteobacteria bacterium]|nr:30S ribosomal protein S6 [Pseudomonadota bacterium]